MKIEDAVCEVRRMLKDNKGRQFPFLNESEEVAIRALLDGYRAAEKDIRTVAACDVCKHYDPDENSCAKPMADSQTCFAWRGPEPGGEEA